MQVTLTILASDIREANYFNSNDCPITRAFKRAGITGYSDTGMHIKTPTGDWVRPTGYKELVSKLVPMLHKAWIDNGKVYKDVPPLAEPETFKAILDFYNLEE